MSTHNTSDKTMKDDDDDIQINVLHTEYPEEVTEKKVTFEESRHKEELQSPSTVQTTSSSATLDTGKSDIIKKTKKSESSKTSKKHTGKGERKNEQKKNEQKKLESKKSKTKSKSTKVKTKSRTRKPKVKVQVSFSSSDSESSANEESAEETINVVKPKRKSRQPVNLSVNNNSDDANDSTDSNDSNSIDVSTIVQTEDTVMKLSTEDNEDSLVDDTANENLKPNMMTGSHENSNTMDSMETVEAVDDAEEIPYITSNEVESLGNQDDQSVLAEYFQNI